MDVANALVSSPLQIELLHALYFVRALVKTLESILYAFRVQLITAQVVYQRVLVTTVFDLFYLIGFILKLKTLFLSFFVVACLMLTIPTKMAYSIWNKSIELGD